MFLMQCLQGKRKETLPTYLYFAPNFPTLSLGHLALFELFRLLLL